MEAAVASETPLQMAMGLMKESIGHQLPNSSYVPVVGVNAMQSDFHKFWLKISAITIGFFGPVLFFGTMPEFNEAARLGLDILTWPVDGFPTYESREVAFLSALTGGFLIGWGVTVWCLAVWVYDAAPEGVRKSLVTGACCWFVLDSAGSITSGNATDALFNIVILLLVVGPMWRPAKQSVIDS